MLIELSSWRPNVQLENRLNAPPPAPVKRYLEGDQQKRTAEILLTNYDTIIVATLRGSSAKLVSAAFGVSDEAIMRRLRPLGLLNPPGVRGRPKSIRLASSQSSRPGSSLGRS